MDTFPHLWRANNFEYTEIFPEDNVNIYRKLSFSYWDNKKQPRERRPKVSQIAMEVVRGFLRWYLQCHFRRHKLVPRKWRSFLNLQDESYCLILSKILEQFILFKCSRKFDYSNWRLIEKLSVLINDFFAMVGEWFISIYFVWMQFMKSSLYGKTESLIALYKQFVRTVPSYATMTCASILAKSHLEVLQ